LRLYLLEQLLVDEEAVHVGAQDGRAHEMVETEGVEVLARDKLVVVVDRALLALLELFGQVVEERAPVRRRSHRGHVVGVHAWLLVGKQDETGPAHETDVVDVAGRLNRRVLVALD